LSTGIIDCPWAYAQASHHERLTGYSTGHEYNSLSTEDLCGLPIRKMMDYAFVWTTGPFIEDAYRMIRSWDMVPITMLAWVKCASIETNGLEAFPIDPIEAKDPEFKPTYGVGYWFRGCVEPIIVAKAPGAPSIRTPFVGLLSPNARHSRKPDSLHQIIEATNEKTGEPLFPGPYIELFGRRARPGWTVLGNQAPGDGQDIRASIQKYLDKMEQIVLAAE
jgi:N6-adenosine-specific RNA methylase IME4